MEKIIENRTNLEKEYKEIKFFGTSEDNAYTFLKKAFPESIPVEPSDEWWFDFAEADGQGLFAIGAEGQITDDVDFYIVFPEAKDFVRLVADEIEEEHAGNSCNHSGDCETFLKYADHLENHDDDAESLHEWFLQGFNKQDIGGYLYDKIVTNFEPSDWISDENLADWQS